jgi:hypothetical protein
MQNLTNSAHFGATLAEAEQHIRNLEPFHTGTLSGAVEGLGYETPIYVVRSYGIAIAESLLFISSRGVLPSAYGHSKTTSKHANLVKKAWDL